MKKVGLLVFDLDGTLIDSRADLTASIFYALQTMGINKCHPQDISDELRQGSLVTIKNCLKSASALNRYDQAINLFKRYYAQHLLDHTVFYPDVVATLRAFGKKKKAVVTNKFQRFAVTIVKEMKAEGLFDLIVGCDTLPFTKPSPEIIFYIMQSLRVHPNKTVLVGDTALDIHMGKNAGVCTCGVTYGFGSREDLEISGADIVIDKISDLRRYFS